uniref:SUMO-activating enzyme subunit 1-like n=1 Tax=Styela clava TaxID=7725 RepID=UPI0019394594|nr:SUMO-activating enzyme subunit 1-like [Styela clava]
MMEKEADITAEEFAQYDRQIRLWGLDAQKRLRQAKVLVVGIGGLASEVVKNVVLAGVKALTMLDDKVVSESDMGSQLLVTHLDMGKNRAEASMARTQPLNPNVIVSCDKMPISEKPDDFFREFDIVCLTEVPFEERIRINLICRSSGIKFFCGDVFGFYGYCFADLGMHDFVREEVKKEKKYDLDGEPEAKKSKLDEKGKKEEEKILVRVTDEFCSLEESLTEDWSTRSRRIMRQSSYIFFIIKVIDKFKEKTGRSPTFGKEDQNLLLELRNEVLKDSNVSETYIPEEFPQFCISELNPICAITGGVLGQEIIKAASQRDAPHNNYFFYNGRSHAGIVDQICPPFK